MAEPLFELSPNFNLAYHNDAKDEYFGEAPKGAATSDAKWRIYKMEYDTSYATAGDPWIIKWADGDDLPNNIWDNVATLSYSLLKAR